MAVPQKIKQNYRTTQQSHFRVYIDPRELRAGAGTDARTPVSTAVLFTVAKRWNRPKCPSTDEWTNNVVHPRQWDVIQP